MLGFTGDGAWAHSAAYASRDEISPDPTMEHGTCPFLTKSIPASKHDKNSDTPYFRTPARIVQSSQNFAWG